MAEERESAALRELAAGVDGVSCAVVRTELRRAAALATAQVDLRHQVEQVLGRLGLLALDDALLDRAGRLSPANLRPLDGLHLAAALRVADHVSAIVTYDSRLAAAAQLHGFEVWAPRGDP